MNQFLAFTCALITALSNALALTTQHIASTRSKESLRGWRLWAHLARQPLWFVGWLALVGSLVFQSLALHFGAMSAVQPLLVAELVFGLVIRQLWLRQRVPRRAWLSALAATAGLTLFLLVSAARTSSATPTTLRWVVTVTFSLAVVAVALVAARRASARRRAALFGAMTGLLWALEATFIKAATDTLSSGGFSGLIEHWPLYAFIVGGIAGLLSEQAALHAGPLRVSQPLIVVVDPLVSVLFGLVLFNERLHSSLGAVILIVVGLAVMSVGVLRVTQSAPETMVASPRIS